MYSLFCHLYRWPCQLQLREPWCASPVWPPPSLRRSSPLSAYQISDLVPVIKRKVWGRQAGETEIHTGYHTFCTNSFCFYLKLSFWGSSNDDHPLSDIWTLCWGDLTAHTGSQITLPALGQIYLLWLHKSYMKLHFPMYVICLWLQYLNCSTHLSHFNHVNCLSCGLLWSSAEWAEAHFQLNKASLVVGMRPLRM